jgi:NlpA lipoprotein
MLLRHLIVSAAALAVLGSAATAETITVGVTAGPHAQILEAVKPIAASKGLDIKIVEFTDYVVPNAALEAGDLQANSFQNQPYLDNQKADRGYKIEAVGLTVNFPIGIYSKRHKSWDAVPEGSTLSIPNDPTNGGRVLLLLQEKGVLKLRQASDSNRPSPISSRIPGSSRSWKWTLHRRCGPWTMSTPPRSIPTTQLPRGSIRSRTRFFAKIPRGPTPTSLRCAPPTRISPGSSFWSKATTPQKLESSF